MDWIVWFAYYSEQANVGIVDADSPDDACRIFWAQHGDGEWGRPCRGVHALPATAGTAIEIHAEH